MGLWCNLAHLHVEGSFTTLLANLLGCSLQTLGFCPVTVVELWGAYYPLEIAWSLDFRRIIIELDSKVVVSLMCKLLDRNHPYSNLIGRIHKLLSRAWEVQIIHTYREGNRVANFMASRGHSFPHGLTIFCDPPMDFRVVLAKDSCGVALPRMVI